MENKKGKLFVVTGPSGVGKGTILNKFFENNKDNVCYSVSMTTRRPRPVEIDGVHYIFTDIDTFKKAIENAFGVTVKSVNTLNTKPKKRRVGRYTGITKTYKKAIVTLEGDSKIEL